MRFLFYTNKFRVIFYSLLKVVNKFFYLLKFLKMSLLLYKCFYKYLDNVLVKKNSVQLFVNKLNVYNMLNFLKNSFYFNCGQLLDFTVVDRLELSVWHFNRYEYIYMLLSIIYNARIYIRGFLVLVDYLVSLYKLYSSVIWLEREVWDMFGVFFYNHKNLRRILTDYGFLGHPLKKDFPLSGFIELRYDDVFKVVVMEPIELLQEFRYFVLESPWYDVK